MKARVIIAATAAAMLTLPTASAQVAPAAPTRALSDILAILDQQKPDPAAIANAKRNQGRRTLRALPYQGAIMGDGS